MPRFSLSCYSIRGGIRDNDSDAYLRLDRFGGSQHLLGVFVQYLAERRALHYSVKGGNQRVLLIRRFENQDELVRGIVETGEFGYEADLRDVETTNLTYKRTTNDAEMMPFYFLAYHFPFNLDEGVLILQRRAQYGIRTVFLQDFADYFRQHYPGIAVEINPLLPESGN